MTIIEHANENFQRTIAPLTYDKCSLGGRYEKSDRKGVIIGHWHEDGNTFEITCPEQLRDSLIELLNNAHLLEFKENK
jgi:hypothetical protein